jgi:hypothetical protein
VIALGISSIVCTKSTIIEKLHPADRVFWEEGRIRNNDPPSPVTTAKIVFSSNCLHVFV